MDEVTEWRLWQIDINTFFLLSIKLVMAPIKEQKKFLD